MASLTPAASPSRIRPSIVTRSPRDRDVTIDSCPARIRAGLKKGPTVCDGVCSGLISAWHRRGVAAAQYKVESVAQRILRNGNVDIKTRYQAFARGFIRDAVEDRIESQQRIAGEIHLGDKARGET